MIVIDSNILIDLFVIPKDERDVIRLETIWNLIHQVETGDIEAIVPEVALHECFYVLVMRLKIISAEQFCIAFSSILDFPGWRMLNQDQTVYFRALDILELHPRIEFSDAVIAARAEAYGAELATFDKRLLSVYDGPVWQPSAAAE